MKNSWIFSLLILCACSPDQDIAKAEKRLRLAEENAAHTIDAVRVLQEVFPRSQTHIRYLGRFGKTPVLEMNAYIPGRYEFNLQCDVSVDGSNQVVQKTPFEVHLNEIIEISLLPRGQLNTRYGKNWTINTNQLETLLKNHGDFSAIDISIDKIAIPNFEKLYTDNSANIY